MRAQPTMRFARIPTIQGMPRWGAAYDRMLDLTRDKLGAYAAICHSRQPGLAARLRAMPLPLLAGTAAALVIGVLPLEQWTGVRLAAHPLWFVMLAVALTFGAPAGSFAAALAAASYTLAILMAPDRSVRHGELLQPLLVFAGAVIASDVVNIQRKRFKKIEQKYLQMAEALDGVTERHLATLDVKDELQRRIIDQTATVTTLYESSKKLESLSLDELFPSVLDLVSVIVDSEACALYLARDGEMKLQLGRPTGWLHDAGDKFVLVLPMTSIENARTRRRRIDSDLQRCSIRLSLEDRDVSELRPRRPEGMRRTRG